ncbi:unnamed protein product [marine sediment metagenome]|uniref:Uncharacterized protein n=1 Tax=marine sediment metagenome TaxID=412755 RepID=X0RYA1_9ZZZZ
MKINTRLIRKGNKNILLIKKQKNLVLGKQYDFIFEKIDKNKICENSILRRFNNDYFYFRIPTKIKGYLKLESQKDYQIKII